MSITGLLLVGAIGLSACGPNIPDPTDAAEQLAQNLASEGFTDVVNANVTEGSVDAETLSTAIAALERFPFDIELESAQLDDTDTDDDVTSATALYTVTWDLADGAVEDESDADQTWSYQTTAQLFWNEESEAWQPQLTSATLVPGLADDGRVAVSVEPAERSAIQDTEGYALARDRPVQRIGLDKTHLYQGLSSGDTEVHDDEFSEGITESATALAEALDLDPEPLVERTLAAGDRAWVEFIVLRDDGDTEIPFEEIIDIPGAMAREDTMVLGPTRSFARSLLGTFGEPSAEQIEASDGAFTAGVATGLSGLQRMHNEQLAGIDGLEIVVDNSEATAATPAGTPVEFRRDRQDGSVVKTTLHTDVQELAESMIDDSDVPAGLVVIRPSDGHILAAADGPADTAWPLAVTGAYPPGSTFKMVTALAMLRNGMTPNSTVQCPQTITIAGTEISNFDGYPSDYLGEITLADAVAQSCNTSFVGQWEELSGEQLQEAAVALGLVADPITGYDGAFLGSVPADVEGAQHASGLFGQGLVQTSPLGMATVAASIAAGETVTPILVTEPAIDPSTNDALPGDEPLTAEEAATLLELMAGPVEYGTVPILQDVPGAPVAAKTGTAQYVADGEDLAHTWIMATHGDLAVSLFYTEGFAGAQTNGPVLQEFLTELEDLIPSTN